MASLESEQPTIPWQPPRPQTPTPTEPDPPSGSTDPYEAAVEQLLALLEENQIALTALAQAWRHTNRLLRLTQTQLAHAQRTLAAQPAPDPQAAKHNVA